MDFEDVYLDIYPNSYISDHGSLESTACSIQEYIPPENFLEVETDVLDLDFSDKECSLVLDGEMGGAKTFQGSINCVAAEQSMLKDIQDELMMQESSLTDILILGAEAVESGNVGFASIVATRLKEILSGEETGDSMPDRLALYFTEGLLNRIMNAAAPGDPVQETNAIPAAFQMLQELSPYVKFAHFTANQAILEATEGQPGEIHVVDFDICEGIQWPSLMVDLATLRLDSSLRITAIVAHRVSSTRTQQTGLRLREFADSINLPFSFDQILITKEEDFGDIRVGHTLIANCMMNQLHMPTRGNRSVKTFFDGFRKLCPKLVVLVQEDLFNFSKAPFMSFAEFFCEAMDHYTALSDSLCSGFSGGYKFAPRVIERELLRMKIMDSVQNFASESPFSMAGFRPIPTSSCNVTQAKHLVSLFNGGYWVQNKRCGLTLYWKSRPLTTASIWVPAGSGRHNI